MLGIEKAKEEHDAAGLTAKAKAAEAKAAEIGVERRILRAPFDGVVLKVKKHVGEWVAAGEPVVEIIRVDRLSIRGGLHADQWPPADIEGRKVTVEVLLPRGRVEKVPGKSCSSVPWSAAASCSVGRDRHPRWRRTAARWSPPA